MAMNDTPIQKPRSTPHFQDIDRMALTCVLE
jgi:hypothetical protein